MSETRWFGVRLLLRATNRIGKMLYEESVRVVKAEDFDTAEAAANKLAAKVLAEYNEDKSFRIVSEDEERTDLAVSGVGEDPGLDEERSTLRRQAPPEAESAAGGQDVLPDPQAATWDEFKILDIFDIDSELEDGSEVYSMIWQAKEVKRLLKIYGEEW